MRNKEIIEGILSEKKSIDNRLKEFYDEGIVYYEHKIGALIYQDKSVEDKEKIYNKAKIELEFLKNDKKRSVYDHPYLEDVNYFDKKRTSKIVKTLGWLNRDVRGVPVEDMTTIFESLNKMERLSNLIKKMKKFQERYKTNKRDKPIIRSLIRLINESHHTAELTNALLDELVGYYGDYSRENKGYESIKDYNNIINYRIKKKNPKPYEEIIFNKVVFNKDVIIQNKKEYNTLYDSLEDICKKYPSTNCENLIKKDAGLHSKHQLH